MNRQSFFATPHGKVILAFAAILLAIIIWLFFPSSPPPPPDNIIKGVKSSKINEDRIFLNWDHVKNALVYEVYRRIGVDGEARRIYHGKSNACEDEYREPNEIYRYEIIALMPNNTKISSREHTILPEGNSDDDVQPVVLPAYSREIQPQSIVIHFEKPNTPLDEIRVERQSPGLKDYRELTRLKPNYLTLVDSTLAAESTYTYRFTPVYLGKKGQPLVLSFTTEKIPDPYPHQPIVTARRAKDSIFLKFSYDGEHTDEIVIERRGGSSAAFEKIATLKSGEYEFNDIVVEPGTRYSYRITATFEGRESKPVTKILKTKPVIPPTPDPGSITARPPKNLRITREGSDFVIFSWENGDANAEQLMVQRRTTQELVFQTLATLPADVTEYHDKNLEAGRKYEYQLVAISRNEQSQPSKPLRFTPKPGGNNNAEDYANGVSAYEAGDCDRAINDFGRVQKPLLPSEQREHYLPAEIYLGKIYLHCRKDFISAETHLRAALSVVRNRAEIYYWLAYALQGQEKHRQAIGAFNKVIKFRQSLSNDTVDETMFNTYYSIIESAYYLWQEAPDDQQKKRYGNDCYGKAQHFLSEYCQNPKYARVADHHTKCENVKIFQQNISLFLSN